MSFAASQYIQNGDDTSSFVQLFRSVNNGKKIKGDIYSFVKISCDKEFPAERVAKFVWDGLLDGYTYSSELSINEAIKDALSEGTRKLRQLIQNDEKLLDTGVDVSYVFVVCLPEGIYLGTVGENDIWVFKDGGFVDVGKKLKESKASTAGIVLSKKDALLISTEDLLSKNITNLAKVENREQIDKVFDVWLKDFDEDTGVFVLGLGKELEKKEDVVLPEVSLEEEIVEEDIVVEKNNQVKLFKDESIFSKSFDFLKSVFVKVKSFFKKISEKVDPFFEKVGDFFKNIFSKVGGKVKDKCSRKKWFKQASAKVSQIRVGRKPKDVGFKVDGYKDKGLKSKRLKTVSAVVLVVALLALGINFTIKQKEARYVHRQADTIFTKVEDLLSKAEGKKNTDKDALEVSLFQIEEEMTKLPSNLSEEDEKLRGDIEGKVMGLQDDLYKRKVVTEDDGTLNAFLDTRVYFTEESSPNDLIIYKDTSGNEYLFVVDSSLKSVYRISLFNKKEIKELPDNNGLVSNPKYMDLGNKGLYVFDEVNGVLRAKFDENGWFSPFESLTGLKIRDIKGGDIVGMEILTESDNVYLLSRESKSVLKATSFDYSYGLTINYITQDNFVGMNDLVSDLSVYVLTSGSDGLNRFIYSSAEGRQVSSPIQVMGMRSEFVNLKCGYTVSSLDYALYLYDEGTKSFLSFEKPKEGGGEILHPGQVVLNNQYIYRGDTKDVFKDVKDIAVDGSEEYMYVLDGTKIWRVSL